MSQLHQPQSFDAALRRLRQQHQALIQQPNEPDTGWYNGVVERWRRPVLTADHVPLAWRYDLSPRTNPLLLERLGINAVFNTGAMFWKDRYVLMTRVEGVDRKSFFAVAESTTGVDQFRFWDEPVVMPEVPGDPETNVYDMRLIEHEDGCIYGIFCAERLTKTAEPGKEPPAIASAGIARTRDLVKWERLPDLVSRSSQQRNVTLHPRFVSGKYLLYTRPLSSFLALGSGPGIGWAICDDMTAARVEEEHILDPRGFHTIKEGKNGLGPSPIETERGWLHLAHGVRDTAAGMRYVLYAFLCDRDDPTRVTHRPGGYLMAPQGAERIGDVSNVLFSNGWVARPDGRVFLYYGSSDTRIHVATTTVERLLDYCINTPPDGLRSAVCVQQRLDLIRSNRAK